MFLNVPAHLAKSTKKIQSIIEGGALAAAIQMDENTLSFWQSIRFDQAFRGEEINILYQLLHIVYKFVVFAAIAETA